MARTIDYLLGPGETALRQAAALVRAAPQVFLTGIGASWNAAMGAGSLFLRAGQAVKVQEAAELLHFTDIPPGSVIVAISRTGRSIEVIQLLAKAEAGGVKVIAITNSADSPLARGSVVSLSVPAKLDYAISVNTYSTLVMAASALASAVAHDFPALAPALRRAVTDIAERLEFWRTQIENSGWPAVGAAYYFLARGGSLGTCHEARLLWEEGVKMPATAMSTSNFRHGPQEIVRPGMRFCLWVDPSQMREQDLSVASDLRELGASVMLVGENLPPDAADLVCQLPATPAHLQFVFDVVPAQIAAERLSRMAGVDCDSFRVCSYIVEDENGLRKKAEGKPNAN